MEPEKRSLLEQGLVYQGEAEFVWESRQEQSRQTAQIETEKNERLLRVLSLFDEQGPERVDDESEASPELMRLEAKLDLVLELLSELVATNEERLSRVPIRLGAQGMEWEQKGLAPGVGDLLWVDLRLDHRLPKPIRVAARVLDVEPVVDKKLVRVVFEHQGMEFSEQLEKFIFRRHRRKVARMRATEHSQ